MIFVRFWARTCFWCNIVLVLEDSLLHILLVSTCRSGHIMPCCGCNRNGHCVRCCCVKAKHPCSNCTPSSTPSHAGQCQNPFHLAASTTESSSTASVSALNNNAVVSTTISAEGASDYTSSSGLVAIDQVSDLDDSNAKIYQTPRFGWRYKFCQS